MTTLFRTRAFAAVCSSLLVVACQGGLDGGGEDSGANASTSDSGPGNADAGPNNTTLDGGDGPDGGTTEPEIPSGNELNQELLFVCGDDLPSTPARIRRIDRHEWTRNTGNSLGSAADKNPFDPAPQHPFAPYSDDESINESMLDIYLDTVAAGTYGWATRDQYRAGALASNVDEESIACMYDEEARPDSDCVRTWVAYLLERGVLFRPPSEQEVDSLVSFAERALDDEASNDTTRRHTLEQVVSAAWMTSGALFRTELGEGPEDEAGRKRLGDWELAQALAYALDGRAPGAPGVYARFGLEWSAGYDGHLPMIRQAAMDGTISNPDKVAEIVRTYFGGIDPDRVDLNLDIRDERRIGRRAEYWVSTGIKEFFQQWLGYPALENIFKDTPNATSQFGEDVIPDYGNLISGYYGHEPTLIEQMDDTIARIIVEDTEVFRKLLTTRQYYTPATAEFVGSSIDGSTLQTNAIYNLTELTEPTREDRWKTLPEDERAGLLTHPAWLAAHAGAFENDPNVVHRGKWIREKLLCGIVPDVPITVEAAFDPETRDQSARQRMTEQVDSRDECKGCHGLMNPLGYPFEIYNHAGFLRVEDHGSDPDGSAVLENMPDPALEGPVSDAVEMSEKFAESQYVKRCFIRQTFRYFMGRDEVQQDACTLAEMEQAYDDSGGSFAEMLIALFNSDSFQYRVDAE
jgi:hypothetical protein